MTNEQRASLARLLSGFIDAHPGTRRGQFFGRPAAFAGAKPFAEITDMGLACRVPARVARDHCSGRRRFRSDRRPGWVVVSAEFRGEDVAGLTALLEFAAVNVATSAPWRSPFRAAGAVAALTFLATIATPVVLWSREAAANGPAAYFTEAQAARGRDLFDQHCGSCHFAEPDPAKARLERRGFVIAKEIVVPSNLGGTYVVDKTNNDRRIYPTVYYLFRELESMPAVTDSISQQERSDILAYLLKQNGFSAGPTELGFDLAAMKLMPLDEPGFLPLFNGSDFSGWRFLIGLGCAPPPDGCGKTEPGRAFTIRDGVMYGSGKEHGIAYTKKKYDNFTLRFDYLSEPPDDWEGDDIYYYANTGYHLFLIDENLFVWPRSLTLAGEQRDLLRPIPLGAYGGTSRPVTTWDNETRARVVRPLGQWNSIEIVSKDGDVEAYLNDTLITTVTQHGFTEPGYIGLQVQGYTVRWRNIRIREE